MAIIAVVVKLIIMMNYRRGRRAAASGPVSTLKKILLFLHKLISKVPYTRKREKI